MERVTSKFILLSRGNLICDQKLCSIWIQTVEYSQFYHLVLCKWDTLFLSDTRLYECFSWLICFVSTFQFQFGEKQTDIYGWILHGVCVIEMFCELIREICNSAREHNLQSWPHRVRGRRAWHRVWPLVSLQTSHFRQLGWSFEITVPPSALDFKYIISNGGDTILSQRKDILHEKWGIILQHCYYRLAINANLIYTLHTLCIEEYNKK